MMLPTNALMRSNRRGLWFGIAAVVLVTILVLVMISVVALWRLTEWGTQALSTVTDSVSQTRQEATRALEDAKATMATKSEPAEVLAAPQAALQRATADAAHDATRILTEAGATVGQTRDLAGRLMAEPKAAVELAVDAAGQEAARRLLETTAAASAAVAAQLDSIRPSLAAAATRDPRLWPKELPLRQVGFRESGEVAEYTYEAESRSFGVSERRW